MLLLILGEQSCEPIAKNWHPLHVPPDIEKLPEGMVRVKHLGYDEILSDNLRRESIGYCILDAFGNIVNLRVEFEWVFEKNTVLMRTYLAEESFIGIKLLDSSLCTIYDDVRVNNEFRFSTLKYIAGLKELFL